MGILDKFKKKKTVTSEKVSAKKKDTKDTKATKATKDTKDTKATKATKATNNIAYKVLVKPLVTEKSTELSNQGKYVFEVNRNSNKIEITKAVEGLYGVNVEKVNVIRVRGKVVVFGRTSGKRKNTKKAIVTLKKGQTIEVFEGV